MIWQKQNGIISLTMNGLQPTKNKTVFYFYFSKIHKHSYLQNILPPFF